MDSQKLLSRATPNDDPRPDFLNLLLAGALKKIVPQPLVLGEIDVDRLLDVLTEEDRRVLAAMGSPQQIVDKIISEGQFEIKCAATDAAVTPTWMDDPASTQPVPGSRFWTAASGKHSDLVKHYESIGCEYQIGCSSNFRMKKELGRGGQGIVYLAECLDEFNLEHALKVFTPVPYHDVIDYCEDMKRMGRVSSLVYRLQIDNLVNVERFVEVDGIYCMLMRVIEGFDLRRLIQPEMVDRLRRNVDPHRWTELSNIVFNTSVEGEYGLQPGYAVNIVQKILRALDALHSGGIVHRDIKPSNIMLDINGSIRLIDIGSASEVSQPPQHCSWTPLYAPPEFLKRKEWSEKSDLASLGYVLIELLSGRRSVLGPAGDHPLGDQSTTAAKGKYHNELLQAKLELPDRLAEILPQRAQQSDQLVRLCRRLIDPEPSQRFPNARVAFESAFTFLKELTQGNLSVNYVTHMQGWLTDAKNAWPAQ